MLEPLQENDWATTEEPQPNRETPPWITTKDIDILRTRSWDEQLGLIVAHLQKMRKGAPADPVFQKERMIIQRMLWIDFRDVDETALIGMLEYLQDKGMHSRDQYLNTARLLQEAFNPDMNFVGVRQTKRSAALANDTRKNILMSFDLYQGDEATGDAIVRLTQEPGSDAVFAELRSIEQQAQAVSQDLVHLYQASNGPAPTNEELLTAAVRRRSRDLVVEAHAAITEAEKTYAKNTAALQQELGRSRATYEGMWSDSYNEVHIDPETFAQAQRDWELTQARDAALRGEHNNRIISDLVDDLRAENAIQSAARSIFLAQTSLLGGARGQRKDIHDSQVLQRLIALMQAHPSDASAILTSFLAATDQAPGVGEAVLTMGEYANVAENVFPVYRAYSSLVASARDNSRRLAEWAKSIDPDSHLDPAAIERSLLRRANDALFDSYEYAVLGEGEIPRLLAELAQENAAQASARSFFVSQSSLLASGNGVSLRECADSQRFVAEAFADDGTKAILLKALQKQRKLAHVPEIFWEVDRPGEDYQRRLGVDMIAFLREFADQNKQKTLVEFGPGNGTFALERAKDPIISKRYANLGICDKVYYPLTPLIEQLIDWETLARDSEAALTTAERREFADFFYKVVVLQPGTTQFKNLVYDQAVQRDLDADASSIRSHLLKKAPLLTSTEEVPSVTCGRDEEGRVFYPHHIRRSSSPAFAAACRSLAQNAERYIRKDKDVYSLIPAYPPGVMISDFMNIDHLKDQEIDIALGIRSTVYLRGAQYIRFMLEMGKKLTNDGCYIDDNARDNDGWYYRIAELLEVKKHADPSMQIKIIIGPALEKEDHAQNAAGVPLGVVMTKDPAKIAYLEQKLAQAPADTRTGAGYRLVDVQELSQQSEYLRTLDHSGRVAASVAAASSRLNLSS